MAWLFASCDATDDAPLSLDNLQGYWVNPVAKDTLVVYERAGSLQNDGYGFAIMDEQRFLERKNAGWCGTPPIAYANYDGSWELTADSVLHIRAGYWGGHVDYQWKLVSVTPHKLTLYPLKEEYHWEID